jgi:transcription-repair coupling factor (superfamily II helicase)
VSRSADAPETRDILLSSVPEGLDAVVLAELVSSTAQAGGARTLVHVARDDRRIEALTQQLSFFAAGVRVIPFPAWDTVPYDRIGPNADIVADRMAALAKLTVAAGKHPTIVLTTVNAILQRVPPRAFIRKSLRQMAPGQRIDMNRLTERLQLFGYQRVGTVMEPGEYAVRGGILDLFPPARSNPVRLDFFGDTLESIKTFDAETQRTLKPVQKLVLLPMSEVAFGEDAVVLFRRRYVELFGGNTGDDPLYESVSAGQRYPGQEHWLPLFHEELETLLDYLPGVTVSFDHLSEDAIRQRFNLINEHYEARVEARETETFGAAPYKPVPPDRMYLDGAAWKAALDDHALFRLTPFDEPEAANVRTWSGRTGRNFAPERQSGDVNVFDAVVAHILKLYAGKRRVVVAAWTPGARERLITLLSDHGLKEIRKVEHFDEVKSLPPEVTALAVVGVEQGFETPELAFIAEQDILGDRLVRPRRKAKRAADVLTEATSLSVGDLVVHADHGIGRFAGLKTITALGAPHDCLEITCRSRTSSCYPAMAPMTATHS